jgi:Uma2 family endonuclease
MATPWTDPVAISEAELEDLERTWLALGELDHKAELIDGEIVVSPSATRRHSSAIDRLMRQLFEVTSRCSWEFHANLTARIPATRERLIPDLMVAPIEAPGLDDNELLASEVLLAVEVTSPSTRRRDRVAKVRAYAQGGVPLYLIIDLLAEPRTVTLLSEPAELGYARNVTVQAGQPLRLPEPFGVDLDTKRLLG